MTGFHCYPDEKLAIDSGPAMLRCQKFAGKSVLLVEKSFESSVVVQDLKLEIMDSIVQL